VLGIDNIIFISILVDKLPRAKQEVARKIGLFLAIFMRIALLLVLSWILGLPVPALKTFESRVAGRDIIGRDSDDAASQSVATMREHDEHFTYVVRNAESQVLLRSHKADPAIFPPFSGMGFSDTPTHRLYSDAALQGTITITVAEPQIRRRIEDGDLPEAERAVKSAQDALQQALQEDTSPEEIKRDGWTVYGARAVNDVVVSRGIAGGMVEFTVRVDERQPSRGQPVQVPGANPRPHTQTPLPRPRLPPLACVCIPKSPGVCNVCRRSYRRRKPV